jgi:hypothetical protein
MESPETDQLPRAYRIGLRLREMSADEAFIADCLGIDPTGVPTLIEIGRQKLAVVQRSGRQLDLSVSDSDYTR